MQNYWLTAGLMAIVAGAMNAILADVFALYLKTKNFHFKTYGGIFGGYRKFFISEKYYLTRVTAFFSIPVGDQVPIQNNPKSCVFLSEYAGFLF